MNSSALEQIVHAVLYEGYLLYPYRSSAAKNQRQRFTFGRVYPQAYVDAQNAAEPALLQTECLIQPDGNSPVLKVGIRFLQPVQREIAELPEPVSTLPPWPEIPFRIVPELRIGNRLFSSWQEAFERAVQLPAIHLKMPPEHLPASVPFAFNASSTTEPIHDDQQRIAGVILRRRDPLEGLAELNLEPAGSHLVKITVRIRNLTPMGPPDLVDPDRVIMRTFASTHVVFQTEDAEFISMLDPPEEHKPAVAKCRQTGLWPVLVGDEQQKERRTMLSSPIILYDYPQLARESPGDLFDATEIDEMLTLRILTMTEQEKREMHQLDPHARRLLQRTERLSQRDMLQMHGAWRPTRSLDEQIFGSNSRLEKVDLCDRTLRQGDRVRICPKPRGDILDIVLAGRTAVIEAVEQDAENRVHLALVLEDDPGRDLGMLRQTGHRFFFGLDEVEPLSDETTAVKSG